MSTTIARPSAVAEPQPQPLPRGRLRAYALWQMRDYLINKGIATALISGLVLFTTWSAAREGMARNPQLMEAVRLMAFPQFVNTLVLFGVLFATNGIIAEDRKFGFYRFYFAKPVRVAEFYAQKFVVHGIGFLLVALLMLGAFGLAFGAIHPPTYLPVIALLFVGLAGIGFLLSALFTLDWLSLFSVYVVALVGWSVFGEDEGVRGMLVRGLPPVHRMSDIYVAMTRGEPLPMEPLWWIVSYGAVCFALGLVVIARRRLATA